MIIVTGTKRSGTSMWMHVLAAAGLPVIGERFPEGWGELLHAANPDGYFESELAAGINFQTNPHPLTGAYLAPEPTRGHAVKVFIPGLVRTDVAFIDRCLATMRDWRSHVRSVRRVRAIVGATEGEGLGDDILPPALQWWCAWYGLVRDIAVRGYAAHVLSYAGLLRDPERHIAEVLAWIGRGDPEAAAAVVRVPSPARGPEEVLSDAELSGGIDPRHLQVFDDLHAAIDEERPLSASLVDALNRTDAALRPLVLEHHASIQADTIARLHAHGTR
jgi:hypothetical protein